MPFWFKHVDIPKVQGLRKVNGAEIIHGQAKSGHSQRSIVEIDVANVKHAQRFFEPLTPLVFACAVGGEHGAIELLEGLKKRLIVGLSAVHNHLFGLPSLEVVNDMRPSVGSCVHCSPSLSS